uniref:C2H2-type domain-containing protein n=1 Tax=Poecilia latipinna TaxID=48699 RepID=A0A3B3VGS7_9TELE
MPYNFIAVSVKSEYDEEKPQLSDNDCIKIEENMDTETSPSMTVEQREAEPDGGLEPEVNSDPDMDENALDSSGTEVSEAEEDGDWQGPFSDISNDKKRSTGKKCFGCSECGKHFISKQSLQRHMKSQVGKRCSSSLNEKCLKVKQNIDSHSRLIGEGSQSKCDKNGKNCNCKDSLQLHLLVHAGDKQFSCEICGKRFKSKYYAQRHIMMHSGKKPHTCDQCGKGFIKKSQLQTHMRLHTGCSHILKKS